ncbi:MAG: hypothetical protein ACI4F4_04475 [Lachnospiraceae bacterium]
MLCRVDEGTKFVPMKWYKFLVYVQLPVTALVQLINAFILIMGMHNNEPIGVIYGLYPWLHIFSVLMGFFSYALCVGTIYVRRCLVYFRKDAPRKYVMLISMCVVANLIDCFIMKFCFSSIDVWGLIGLAIHLLLIIYSCHYFKERKDMFVK